MARPKIIGGYEVHTSEGRRVGDKWSDPPIFTVSINERFGGPIHVEGEYDSIEDAVAAARKHIRSMPSKHRLFR